MNGFALAPVDIDHVEPVPRRVHAVLAGQVVLDTLHALYVWEWPNTPLYYVPANDIDWSQLGSDTVQVVHEGALADHARCEWSALDAWFEDGQQLFVHPRSPYSRIDAWPATRHVRVTLDGVLLAETDSPVLLYETGLPTRYYIDPSDVRFENLIPSSTQTHCPFKGVTSRYWSTAAVPDVAWVYDFPLASCAAIQGRIAFYNDKVELAVS